MGIPEEADEGAGNREVAPGRGMPVVGRAILEEVEALGGLMPLWP